MAGRRLTGSRLATRIRTADPALLAALGAGMVAVAVIRTTMLPTVGMWDTAEAQVVLPLLGTMHPTGFPAFVVLGWLVSIVLQPLGTPAFVNLMPALLVGVAVGGSVFVTRRLGAPLAVAVAVAAGFALTPDGSRTRPPSTCRGGGALEPSSRSPFGKRPVFVIRMTESEVQDLTDRYRIEPVGRPGNLYRVTGRQETTP